MYYQIAMRLDISFPVGKCARYMANHGMPHTLKWIETHPNAYLEFRQPKDDALRNVLVWFVDSNWASDPDDMKSTLGPIGDDQRRTVSMGLTEAKISSEQLR